MSLTTPHDPQAKFSGTVGPSLPSFINPETHPSRYRHWKLSFDGPIATLSMDVTEDAGLSQEYRLKLNSYDLSVDIELNDAISRLRFEHPEVHTVVVTSVRDRIFCAGANIFMLGLSSHAFKVNFCKFTNETRLSMEDASENSGISFLAAVNGVCAGGGYELALACDEIYLVDDGSSAVSLPEVPLLGVLPGTGGLTRVVDKRMVRRDLAEVFCTAAEGVRGKRAVQWGLVDAAIPKRDFDAAVQKRARELAEESDRPDAGPGFVLEALDPVITDAGLQYHYVTVTFQRAQRLATIVVKGPSGPQPTTPEAMLNAGTGFWALRAFRELEHALLCLRLNEPELGNLVLKTEGDMNAVLEADALLQANLNDWAGREVVHFMKRTLKRLDNMARGLFCLVEPGSCFAGSLFELALASDRIYMLNDPAQPTAVALSPLNFGPFPMGNGLTRIETRFLGEPEHVSVLAERMGDFLDASTAESLGLITFAPDEIDWDDEVRIALEERASLSPDSLTGLEQNLRFAGPETLETKIFGRLTAWQNWIFQRPNAVGEKGALKVYGKAGARAEFDWRRT